MRRRRSRRGSRRVWAAWRSCVLAEDLGVVARARSPPSSSVRSSSCRPTPRSRPSTSAPTSRRRESPSRSMAFGLGCEADRRDVPQPDRAARRACRSAGCSIASTLVARLRGAPDDDVVGLAAAEDVADLLAGHQGRGGPADVAGLEPVPARPCARSTSTWICGTSVEMSTCGSLDAVDAGQDARGSPAALLAQDRQVLAVDPDDDRLLAAGEHLLDALVEVGLDLAEEPGVRWPTSLDRARASAS